VKITDQFAGHEIARHEITRHENAGHENAGHENARHENDGRRAVAVLGKNIWGAWPLIIWEATVAKRNYYRIN